MSILAPRRRRVIDTLRATFPQFSWRYDQDRRQWLPLDQPWHVYACSAYTPDVNGAEIFQTQYRRSDTGDVVFCGRTWNG